MMCRRCQELSRQLERAREEIREWEAFARDERRADADDNRLAAWRAAMDHGKPQGVLTLMALVDRPDRLLNRWAIVTGTRTGPNAKTADEVDDKLACVLILQARGILRALARTGRLPARFGQGASCIVNHRAYGWVMAAEDAAEIRALVGEA
jgi:hypothetical protein